MSLNFLRRESLNDFGMASGAGYGGPGEYRLNDACLSDKEMAYHHPVVGRVGGGPPEDPLSYGCEHGSYLFPAGQHQVINLSGVANHSTGRTTKSCFFGAIIWAPALIRG